MKMRNVLSLFVLICLIIPLSSAEVANIALKSPAGGTVVASQFQEFIFSFDKYSIIENCSLIIDGSFKALRNTMISMENNKMSATLESGEHTWQIICYDDENNKLVSEERKLKIITGEIIKTDYETIYNNNGLRSYLIQIAEGKAPVELPAMKLSEDIRIKTPQKTHYIDLLRMGAESGTFFVEVRDRSNSEIHRILIGESVQLDLDNDKIIDVSLNLKNIERNVNAYFIVTSYPSTQPAEETQPIEQPSDEPEADSETTTAENEAKPESPVVEEQEDLEADSKPIDQEEIITEDENASKSTILLIAAVIILILILATIMIVKNKGKKASKNKKDKNAHKIKSESAHKAKVTEIKKEPEEDLLSDEPIKRDDDEDFDIITSVGKKRR